MTSDDHREPGRGCVRCPAPATVCHECVRAIALQWFGAIARHPEAGTDCQLCQQGLATYCGHCFVAGVASYRAALLKASTRIGEPIG